MSLVGAIGLSSALAALALVKRALMFRATALAWLMSVLICLFGGLPAFLMLAACLIFTVAADKYAGGRADPQGLRRKSGRRDSIRVFCNVGMGAAVVLLYGLTAKPAFLLAYAAAMAESLSDSLASKLGPLTKGKTVDICTFRSADVGISGGISLLGIAVSALGAAAMGALSLCFPLFGVKEAIFVAFTGFVGCLIDSVLGSLAQAKYLCPACGSITEREIHCTIVGNLYKGFRPVNNDAVNFISNLLTTLMALMLSLIQ